MARANWGNIGSMLSSVSTTLSSLGITGSNASTILSSIGLSSNPNKSTELAICQQILTFSAMGANNPSLMAKLAEQLATEQGIPQDAAALSLTLMNPGVNITQTVLEIEQLINQGG